MTLSENTPDGIRALYESMTHEQLVARLKVAEDTLVLIGWSSTKLGDPDLEFSDRAKAAEQAWHMWAGMVEPALLEGLGRPDLDALIPTLAAARDRIRSETLAKIERLLADPEGS